MARKNNYEDKNDEDKNDEDKNDDFFNLFRGFSDLNNPFRNLDPAKLFNFRKIAKKISKILPEDLQGLPIIYGFNIDISSDGKPVISSFGNIENEPLTGETKLRETREPLVEVNEEEDQIVVIVEMPGVRKDDIEISIANKFLTISTEKSDLAMKYFKEVELPNAVNSDNTKARYTNGILEIKLKKIEGSNKKTSVEIE